MNKWHLRIFVTWSFKTWTALTQSKTWVSLLTRLIHFIWQNVYLQQSFFFFSSCFNACINTKQTTKMHFNVTLRKVFQWSNHTIKPVSAEVIANILFIHAASIPCDFTTVNISYLGACCNASLILNIITPFYIYLIPRQMFKSSTMSICGKTNLLYCSPIFNDLHVFQHVDYIWPWVK